MIEQFWELLKINPLNSSFFLMLTMAVTWMVDAIKKAKLSKEDRAVAQKWLSEPRAEPSEVDIAPYQADDFWTTRTEQAEITAVTGGKGGVGKSSLALGLMEYYSADEKVLLVDFDLHNRGLSSKFAEVWRPEEITNVFSEMGRFQQQILPFLRERLGDKPFNLASLDSATFVSARELFCYEDPLTGKIRPLKLAQLPRRDSFRKSAKHNVRPEVCYFLPARNVGQSFLSSKIFKMDIPEIAIFIKFLSAWAHKRYAITRIVLDCHGAHDFFMVGAILASNRLAVVSKPDPSCFDGTQELLEFSRSLTDGGRIGPRSEVLVINEYRDSDQAICDAMLDSIEVLPNTVLKIRAQDRIRRTFKSYQNPSVINNRHLWANVEIAANTPPGGGSAHSDLTRKGYFRHALQTIGSWFVEIEGRESDVKHD